MSARRAAASTRFSRSPSATICGEARKPMNAEDLTEIERVGRRCGVCHSGRGWRRFEVVRPAEREPVVLCGGCRARFGDDPLVGRKPEPVPEPTRAAAKQLSPPKPPRASAGPSGARIASKPHCASCPARSRRLRLPEQRASAAIRHSPGYATWSIAARSGASATAGRPSRPLTASSRRLIGFRRGRATFGSSGTGRRSADQRLAQADRRLAPRGYAEGVISAQSGSRSSAALALAAGGRASER